MFGFISLAATGQQLAVVRYLKKNERKLTDG
jgi:hypothetical protein